MPSLVHDVLVVGGGVIGLASAWALARAGRRVRLIERGRTGEGASRAAGGMITPQLESDGSEEKLALGLYARTRYPEWVAALAETTGLDVDHRGDGAVRLARGAELDALELGFAGQRAAGLRVERLDRAGLEVRCPGLAPAFDGGLWLPDEARVDPRRLLLALREAAIRTGVELDEGAELVALLRDGGRVLGAQLADGRRLHAAELVLAAGVDTARIEGAGPELGVPALEPVRGQMLALRPDDPLPRPFVWTGRGYLIPRSDGRLVVGATSEPGRRDPTPTAGGLAGLLGAALEAFPGWSEAPVIETWSGLRPATADRRPRIGRATDGLVLALGHHRNGIAWAPPTAEAVVAAVHGEAGPAVTRAFAPRPGEAASGAAPEGE
jgi:glycine oxidase